MYNKVVRSHKLKFTAFLSTNLIPFRENLRIVRPLFTAETLDLLAYQSNRQDARNNVQSPHRFKWELQCYIENEKEKEAANLKNAIEVLVHLIQLDIDDVKLIKNSLYAYGSTEGVTDKAKRAIGNLVMKAIYTINMPSAAIEVKTRENCYFVFFSQILLPLLNDFRDFIIHFYSSKLYFCSSIPIQNRANFSAVSKVL